MSREYESALINLSLQILRDACYASGVERGMLPVRLALRVLMPFVKDRAALASFWTEFTRCNVKAWDSCHPAYSGIKATLEAAGWQAAEEDYPPPAPDACAQICLSTNVVELIERFGIRDFPGIDKARPALLVSPGSPCWVITWGHGQPDLRAVRWGIRRTVAAIEGGRRTSFISTIREPERDFWRKGAAEKGVLPGIRCLIPVQEFGHRAAGVSTGPATDWFTVPSAPHFAIAGLWVGDPHDAVAIHVSPPNPLLAAYGDAMPLILHPEDERRWLEHGDLTALAEPFPSQLMEKTRSS